MFLYRNIEFKIKTLTRDEVDTISEELFRHYQFFASDNMLDGGAWEDKYLYLMEKLEIYLESNMKEIILNRKEINLILSELKYFDKYDNWFKYKNGIEEKLSNVLEEYKSSRVVTLFTLLV